MLLSFLNAISPITVPSKQSCVSSSRFPLLLARTYYLVIGRGDPIAPVLKMLPLLARRNLFLLQSAPRTDHS
jgi:hypothetical protein